MESLSAERNNAEQWKSPRKHRIRGPFHAGHAVDILRLSHYIDPTVFFIRQRYRLACSIEPRINASAVNEFILPRPDLVFLSISRRVKRAKASWRRRATAPLVTNLWNHAGKASQSGRMKSTRGTRTIVHNRYLSVSFLSSPLNTRVHIYTLYCRTSEKHL